jgi:anti-sigma B factor antagonist
VNDANGPSGRTNGEQGDPGPAGDPSGELGSVHVIVAASKTRIVLSGEIDASLSRELQDAAADAENAGRPVEVDARHVRFMDSTGVTLLARLATRTPGRIQVIRPPDVVRFLLEITHIGDLVDVVDSDPGFEETTPRAPEADGI